LACALKNSGLRIVLIEAQPPSVAVARKQAYALSLLSGRIFKGIGVWDKILPQITTYRQIRLSDADYRGIVQFHPTDLGTDALGYVGEHHPLLTSLYEFLGNCPNVTW
ncbi:MAG TPA: 2-octaprenyl-6-methoxyphenyl hydroxylase, partial [Cyanobacteria bacterium UBA12227]|nr:2-octaprenyl-6-methoxyphenyl hydroxylase [Cyanobacteria bacterium UBA12227]